MVRSTLLCINAGGTPTSIVDIPVTAMPFYTGSIWNMGNPDIYPPGTYTSGQRVM